ncbi:MAG: putative xylanase/chitin deacetylase [Frankiales bacterium]|nr:putative xylanase/chitin deacetylase [Frankiales bacterium]
MSGERVRRAVLPLLGAGAVVHALPALTARGPAKRLTPNLIGNGRPGGVALTFDDGPDAAGTPPILEALDALGWQATFFLLGSQVRRHPDVARSIVAAGHELGVHGDVHRNHLARTPLGIRRDLRTATAAIVEVTGVRPRWFRPPYGVLSAGTLWAAADTGLTTVLWTAWGLDWRAGPADGIVSTIMKQLADGGTVLLHDSDCTSRPGSWRSTLAALPLLAEELRARDLEVRPLREHLTAAA